MNAYKNLFILSSLLLLMACVTINVYFPAAAAESAADTIIKQVYGKDQNQQNDPATEPDQTYIPSWSARLIAGLLEQVIPPAFAQQPDINISTPGINRLRSLMTERHARLEPYYNSGAVGMDAQGLITLRAEEAIPLRERNTVKMLVADENRDRLALYSELAEANGHPEWEAEIRATFARRWVANAPGGWWYVGPGGNWSQK
ncbi:MAG: DUF1318 domain-containing protein [Gammaproteobacteria bacterium]|nr:MAG: DUF1318 domain-containing protein [Gammaproteobacteria bacterium]